MWLEASGREEETTEETFSKRMNLLEMRVSDIDMDDALDAIERWARR